MAQPPRLRTCGRDADNSSMKSRLDVCEAELEELPVVLFERRRRPDRRSSWRGGRRDSDWLNRPPDSLDRLGSPRRQLWRRWAKP